LSSLGFADTLRVLARDRAFLLLTLGNVLTMFVYAHFQSTLDLYLMRLSIPDIAALITQLLLINSLTIVFLQLPLVQWLARFSAGERIRIGTLLFALAQLGFWFTPISWPMGWLLSAFVLSVGEVILFPALNLRVDELAPPHLRGSYVGAASLYLLGSASAPILGGLIIDQLDGRWLFVLCIILCAIAYGFYKRSENRPDYSAANRPEQLTTEEL
ncbi:MAG: MFS transporter, partial [Aeromonadaceae bacterium]|nr:MFS transporter [Aeromonadaceae bacterium]